MSDPSGTENWLVEAILWVMGLIVTFVGGSSEYNRRKLAKCVTREELATILKESVDENNLKHQQNLNALNNLSLRIDRLLERLAK